MRIIRIGNGYDVHRLAEGESLILGGVEVPHVRGTVAHSDGDVLVHALCDALLGALALGDIGRHFPDNDPQYGNADSLQLLARCMELVRERGYGVGNADMMLLLERPKIKDYVPRMREKIAAVLGVSAEDVSVKATTGERMGFVGREEGVEATAVVLLFPEE